MYKQEIKVGLMVNPKANNLEIAEQIGIHRNTVSRMLKEISKENELAIRERWKMLLNDMTDIADAKREQLARLWYDVYWIQSQRKPSQLAVISKLDWQIQKDLYRMHLEYMGQYGGPSTLVQVNVGR